MKTFKCMNVQCRVETFKGETMMPMNACPVCLSPGAMVSVTTQAKKSS